MLEKDDTILLDNTALLKNVGTTQVQNLSQLCIRDR